MTPRLSAATLPGLSISGPAYDRSAVKTGIVHLGIGAFHRAHQAVYTEAVLGAGDLRWGILGASLRSPDTRDALMPQDNLYTLAIKDDEVEKLRIIGAVRHIFVAAENPARLVRKMAHEDVRIVSLTVTEKGYCHDPATGNLRIDHPDIVHDIANPLEPRSALGFIIAALMQRRAANIAPFTVLTCDNLPANGATVKRVLVQLAQQHDAGLGDYVAQHLACPATMVDRIVPATTEEDRARIATALGARDAWPVVTEPFSQWVIEDDFPSGRPAWDQFGAQFVKDVAPFELMKLRLLNGAHSSLAYLGYLAGKETVAQAMAVPVMAAFVERLMRQEVSPTLHVPAGTDIAAYQSALIARFRNPALHHRTWQIAMDGSQKLPQRLLGTIRDRLAAKAPFPALALGVAAWMAYVTGIGENGAAIDVRDPMSAELRARADLAGRNAHTLALSLLEIEAIFGSELPRVPSFTQEVITALNGLLTQGALQTVTQFMAHAPNAI